MLPSAVAAPLECRPPMNRPLPILDLPGPVGHAPGADVPERESDASLLADAFGRAIGYLRLSLTSACAMRCLYCRPETHDNPRNETRLTPDEIYSLVAHLAQHHGLTKVRLTGGDPTSRPDLDAVIRAVAAVPQITDLAMTTNALTLERRAEQYLEAGLDRVNISLDTLDRERFAELTGVDQLERVVAGIHAAQAAGLTPIKINTVVVADRNEQDLPALLRFAADHEIELRLIELMPMGPLADKWSERYVPESRMRQTLDPHIADWSLLRQGHSAARPYRVTLTTGQTVTLGFITPMSCNFCADCNRIRVAADGTLYPCLMDKASHSLLPAIRPGFSADYLDRLLASGLNQKAEEHPHDGAAIMTTLGG